MAFTQSTLAGACFMIALTLAGCGCPPPAEQTVNAAPKTEGELLAEYSLALDCLSYASGDSELEAEWRRKTITAGAMVGKTVIDVQADELALRRQNAVNSRRVRGHEGGRLAGCWD